MPPYGSQPYVEFEHSYQPLWTGEQPAPGNGGASASYPVRFPAKTESFFVDGHFSAAPGVFEIDVQGAAEDFDAEYQTLNGGLINQVDAVNFTFRLDFINVKVRYVRVLMRTRTNAVLIYCRITR